MSKGLPAEHKGEKFEEELERVKWFSGIVMCIKHSNY